MPSVSNIMMTGRGYENMDEIDDGNEQNPRVLDREVGCYFDVNYLIVLLCAIYKRLRSSQDKEQERLQNMTCFAEIAQGI